MNLQKVSLKGKNFKSTHKRNDAGKYIVQMPTKKLGNLGDSKDFAKKMFQSITENII